MQHDNMELHAILRKFHIGHTQNGATVIAIICPKQQLGILQASKQHATASQHENKRYGHDVQVKHNKTWTLSYLHKLLEHAQTHMARLQIISVSDMAEITSGCNV